MTLPGLDRVEWSTLRHAYGSAGDVPELLRRIAEDQDAPDAVSDLTNKIYHQGGFVCSAATAALPFMVLLAGAAEVTVRRRVVELLGHLAGQAVHAAPRNVARGWRPAWQAALPSLLALLDDADVEVRRGLTRALSEAAADADPVVTALCDRYSREEDPAVRTGIILAVGELAAGCSADVLPEAAIWLRGLREHADPQVRLAAAVALDQAIAAQRLGTDLDTLIEALGDDGIGVWRDVPWVCAMPARLTEHYGGSAARLVGWVDGRLGDDATTRTEVSLAFIGHRDADRRVGAVRAAAEVFSTWRSPGERLLPALAERTADPAGAVRAYATHVLAAAGEETDQYRDLLAARLSDDQRLSPHGDGRISDIAAWGLAWRHDPRCLPHLLDRLGDRELGYGTAIAHGYVSYATTLPAVQEVLAPLREHADVLLPAIRERLRDGGHELRRALAGLLEQWGEASAPAVPELVDLLGTETHPHGAFALGAIGPAAGPAGPVIERLLRRPSEPPGTWNARVSAVALPWAYWRITGDPEPALAAIGGMLDARSDEWGRREHWLCLADLGTHATAHIDRIRGHIDRQNTWEQVFAAHALYRITGDPEPAVQVLCQAVWPLASGKGLPVAWAALRYLAEMGASAEGCHRVLRDVLGSDRRHGTDGGWRRLTQDRELRELAAGILRSAEV
ncbi:HEAT repeat domain-containing protein [Actinomadura viridis]|uniref:HEAT repeat domain-containing protein n=1 Tax=Actinomadura viridis TaxID=58110 RepID=UPI0036804A80